MNTFIKSMALCALLAGSTALQASQAARDLKAAIQNKDKAKALSLVDAVREFYSTQPRNFARFAQDFRDQFGQSIDDAMDEVDRVQTTTPTLSISAAAEQVEVSKQTASTNLDNALQRLINSYPLSNNNLQEQKDFLISMMRLKYENGPIVQGTEQALDDTLNKITQFHSVSNGIEALQSIIDQLTRLDERARVARHKNAGTSWFKGLMPDSAAGPVTQKQLNDAFKKDIPAIGTTRAIPGLSSTPPNINVSILEEAGDLLKELSDMIMTASDATYADKATEAEKKQYMEANLRLKLGDSSLAHNLTTELGNIIAERDALKIEKGNLNQQISNLQTQLAAAQAQPQAPAPAPAQQTQTQQPQPQAPAQPAQAPAQPAQAPAFDVNTASADDFMKEFKRITNNLAITTKDIMRNLVKLSSNLNQGGNTNLKEQIEKANKQTINNFLKNSATVNPTTDQLTAIRAALNMLLNALTNKSYTWEE